MNPTIMKTNLAIVLGAFVVGTPWCSHAALSLTGNQYTESFDSLESGLPNGWTVRTGASSANLGTIQSFTTSATSWAETGGRFKNLASADGLTSSDTTANQSASADRALGIRQTEAFGDPGAAFVLQIADTTGFENISISFKAQMLSVQTRSTTWTFDYRIGDSGNFISLGTSIDPGVFGSTLISLSSSQLSTWDNQSSAIWFRIAALENSTGSGSRDTFAIDDFSISYAAVVPEPSTFIAGALLALPFGAHGIRYLRHRKRA